MNNLQNNAFGHNCKHTNVYFCYLYLRNFCKNVIYGSIYIVLFIPIKYVNYKYTRRRCVPSIVKRGNIKMIDAIRKVMP